MHLPEDFKRICLVIYGAKGIGYKIGNGRIIGASAACLTPGKYMRAKRNFLKWATNVRYYYENREDVIPLTKKYLVKRKRCSYSNKQYRLFWRVFFNPFVSPAEVGKHFNISESTVRVIIRKCCKKLSEEEELSLIIKNFDSIKFKYLRDYKKY